MKGFNSKAERRNGGTAEEAKEGAKEKLNCASASLRDKRY